MYTKEILIWPETEWSELELFVAQDGFVQSLADPCVYVKSTEFGQVIAIVWVDDIIIAGSNTDVLKKAQRVSYDEIQNERPRCFIMDPRYPVQV